MSTSKGSANFFWGGAVVILKCLSQRVRSLMVFAIALVASPAPVDAATLYWNGVNASPDAGGGTGAWNTATNWMTAETGGSAVAWNNTTPDSAVFGVAGGTVTLGAARSAAGITFTTGGYVIGNAPTRVLTIGSAGITQTSGAGATNQIGTGALNTGYVTLSASQEWLNQSSQLLFQRDGNLDLGSHTLTLTSTGGGGINPAGTATGTGNIVVSANTTVGMSANNVYSGTTTIFGTLTINSLTNFSSSSGLGDKSSNAASNLVFDGGTLRVQVSTGSSDRRFTLGSGGGTLFSLGGTGTITLTDTNAIAFSGSGARSLTLDGSNAVTNTLRPNLGDAGGDAVSLMKSGTPTWSVTGTNTYTGGTTVNAGTLTMGSATALGSTSGQLTVNGGTLNMAGNSLAVGNLTGTGGTISGTSGTRTLTIGQGDGTGGNFQGVIANGSGGTTALTKTGTGTITLSGNSTYTGATAINAGTLRVNGSLGATAITVGASGTLGGNGTLAGALTMNGALAPGNSIGALTTTNDVTWNGSASTPWVFELGGGNTADLLDITGGTSDFLKGTGNATVDFMFDFAGSTATGNFTLVSWGNSTTFLATDFVATNLGGSNTGNFSIVGNSLHFIAVPEPSTIAFATCGLIALAALRYRRKEPPQIR